MLEHLIDADPHHRDIGRARRYPPRRDLPHAQHDAAKAEAVIAGSSAGIPTRPSSSMSAPLELSLVVPVYNERDNLPILVERSAALAGGERRALRDRGRNDGSTDGSLDVSRR